jgi:hypothetical protein
MADFVGVDVTGLKELQVKLAKLPVAVQDAVVDDLCKYYIDVYQSEQPSPNYVSRASAYPNLWAKTPTGRMIQGYKSWEQFQAVMAKTKGQPYKRTQALRRGWRQVGRGARSFIANDTPGSPFVVDDEGQSRHEKLVGWYRATDLANKRIDKALRRADGAVKKAIMKLGLD